MKFLPALLVFGLAFPLMAETGTDEALALNLSLSPVADSLVALGEPVEEDGFQMRFHVAASFPASALANHDLTYASKPVPVKSAGDRFEISLPNDGTCTIQRTPPNDKDPEMIRVTFSGKEIGVPAAVPAAKGDCILLVSPLNNINERQVVLVKLP